MSRNLSTVAAAFSASLALAGCGLFGDSGSSGDSQSAGRIRLVPTVGGGAQPLARVGGSGEAGLQSFQVAVSNILIAKDLTTSGSGWSGMSGPLSLYSNDIGDFNAIDSNQARDPAWRSNFIDFCDQASLERIATSQPFTLRDTGEYHWAVINWAPFFRVRAEIPLPGGDTLYTRDGYVSKHIFPNSGPDNAYYVTRSPQSLLQGPAEDALVRKNNGGTWFRFLKPLRLTEADLDSTSTIADTVGFDSSGNAIVDQIPSGRWNVLLVFNPRDLVFGGEGDSSNMSVVPSIVSPDSTAYINVPFLKATAVPYREGEAVTRETYEFEVSVNEAWANGTYGMRLELYLIGDNVVAASVHSYPTDGGFAPPEVPVIFFADEKDDGTLSLQGWDRAAVFDGFARKQSVGEEGTVAWDPSSHAQQAQTLTYRLAEIRRMN